MRVNAQNGMLALEQRLQSVTIEYDQLSHAAHTVREYYHGEVERILNEIVKFKVHIQQRLGEWDEDVITELDQHKSEIETRMSQMRI